MRWLSLMQFSSFSSFICQNSVGTTAQVYPRFNQLFFFYKHCSFSGLLINFVIAEWIMTCLLWSSFNLKISLFLFSKLQCCWLESSETMYMRHKIVFIARLTDHDWLTNQLTDQPTNQPTDRLTNWPTNRPIDRPTKRSDWLIKRMNE